MFNRFSTRNPKPLAMYTIIAGSVTGLTVWLLLNYVALGGARAEKQQPITDELLVIDTDAGNDDAVAILTILGDDQWRHKLTAITCVTGNTHVDHVTTNVLKILKIANMLQVPVYRGASQGLVHETNTSDFFGTDGLGDANFPEEPPQSLIKQEHAAVYLANAVKQKPGAITILMIGPMTNVALAIRLNPQFMVQVRRIISLGGAIAGGTKFDSRPAVEFNIYKDVESATVVLQEVSKATRPPHFFTLLPVEPILEILFGMSWRKNVLGKINNGAVDFLNRIERNYLTDEEPLWMTFDFYTAAILLRAPETVSGYQEVFVEVELEGRLTCGRLVVDYYDVMKQPPNVRLITGLNKNVTKTILFENLNKSDVLIKDQQIDVMDSWLRVNDVALP